MRKTALLVLFIFITAASNCYGYMMCGSGFFYFMPMHMVNQGNILQHFVFKNETNFHYKCGIDCPSYRLIREMTVNYPKHMDRTYVDVYTIAEWNRMRPDSEYELKFVYKDQPLKNEILLRLPKGEYSIYKKDGEIYNEYPLSFVGEAGRYSYYKIAVYGDSYFAVVNNE